MKGTSKSFITFIHEIVLLFVLSAHSASTREDEWKTQFEKEGFIFIGQMSPDTSPNSSYKSTTNYEDIAFHPNSGLLIPNYNQEATMATSSGIGGIYLWLSGPNQRETQENAMRKCQDLHGDLLFILNDRQLDDVRLQTRGRGGPFWTSACYDENLRNFAYFRGGSVIPVTFQHIRRESRCRQRGTNMGLVVQGRLSTFGLCSAKSNTRLRYICRVPR